MEKLLTIAIAAYNKEDLLPRCLDSIIISPELMSKVQVLVINDGSKDNTLNVARKYEEKYQGYIFAIDKSNGNYGSVMNKALLLAEGKYFRTLDADDWYDTEAYEKFIVTLSDTNADLLITERKDFFEDSKQIENVTIGDAITGLDITAHDAFSNISNYNSCLNVQHFTFRTELLRRSGLKWIEGICYTDTMFDMWPLPYVETVRIEKLPVYVYLIGTAEQSTNPENTRKNIEHFVKIFDEALPYYKKHYICDAPYASLMKYFMHQLLLFIYLDIWIDDRNVKIIQKVHKMLEAIPDIKAYEEKLFSIHGINYLNEIERTGDTGIDFKIYRKLRHFSNKIKSIKSK